MKKLKEELAKEPKPASLDVKVDGEQIGHMVLKMGGSYDLNLKSEELPKGKTENVKLVDDGSKISKVDSEVNDIAKKISGSLKEFA